MRFPARMALSVVLFAIAVFSPQTALAQTFTEHRPEGVSTAQEFGDMRWAGDFRIPADIVGQAWQGFEGAAGLDKAQLVAYYHRLVRGALNNMAMCDPDVPCPAMLRARLWKQTGSPNFMLQYAVATASDSFEIFEHFINARVMLYIKSGPEWISVGAMPDLKGISHDNYYRLELAAYSLVERDAFRVRE